MYEDLIEKIAEKNINLENFFSAFLIIFDQKNSEVFFRSVANKIIKNQELSDSFVKESLNAIEDISDGSSSKENIKPCLEFLLGHSAGLEEKCLNAQKAQKLIRKKPSLTTKTTDLQLFSELTQNVGPDFILPFDIYRTSFLHKIAQTGAPVEFLEILFAKNANFTATNLDGNTALLAAIANAENDFAVSFLKFATEKNLEIGINMTDTALHLAAAKGYTDRDSDKRPLKTSNLQLTKALLHHLPDLNIKNKFGFSALDLAVMRRDSGLTAAICSSKFLLPETVESAKNHVALDHATATKNIKKSVVVFLPPEQKNFNEKTSNSLLKILDQALSPNPHLSPTSATTATQSRQSSCTIS